MTWHLPFGEEIVPDDVDYMPVVPKFNGETWNSLLYRISQLMSLHGQNKDAFQKGSIGAWEYDVIGPWYKCNMTDIAAAMGLVQFERYPDILARRKSLIKRMDTAFAAAGLDIHVLRHYTDCCESSGHLYICRLPGYTREQTNRVILQMGERGIACNVHYKPLPMMTGYKALGFDIADFPEARAFYENELTLPLYSRMSDADAEYVIGNFIEVLGKEYVPSADVAEPSVTSAPAEEIDSGFLDSLTAQAKASPRLRMNFDLRTPSDIPGVDSRDSSQRMLNALEPGTQVDVHRHCNSTECFVVLRGKCVLYYYDDTGRVTGEMLLESPVAGDGSLRSGLAPASRQMVSVEKCRWHKIVSLESGTVIYGSMDGVYEPQKQEDILKL